MQYRPKPERDRDAGLHLLDAEALVCDRDPGGRDQARARSLIVHAFAEGRLRAVFWDPEVGALDELAPPGKSRRWLGVRLDWEGSRVYDDGDFGEPTLPDAHTNPVDPYRDYDAFYECYRDLRKLRQPEWRVLLITRASFDAIWPPGEPVPQPESVPLGPEPGSGKKKIRGGGNTRYDDTAVVELARAEFKQMAKPSKNGAARAAITKQMQNKGPPFDVNSPTAVTWINRIRRKI